MSGRRRAGGPAYKKLLNYSTGNQAMANLRFKRVFRLDTLQGHFRLFRIMWETHYGENWRECSHAFSVALMRWPLLWLTKGDHSNWKGGWFLFLLGLRIHYQRSYGGRFG